MDPQQDQPMDTDTVMDVAEPDLQAQPEPVPPQPTTHTVSETPFTSTIAPEMKTMVSSVQSSRAPFRDIAVKLHIRRPERDSWSYLGRAIVTQEVLGQSSRLVVRSMTSGKVFTTFHEGSAVQAEKRGNFVVVGCIENNRVVSWSLNALNNSETLRLLASIELACYACKQAISDPTTHNVYRRRVARIIKDDRRRRHRRRKDQDALVNALARTGLDGGVNDESLSAPTTPDQQTAQL